MFWVDPRFLSQPGPRFLLLCLAHHASFNETFQFLFWTMFGMEEHTVVDMPQFLVPEFVGRAMYGIFTIVMVIVLLNMLIAMITNSFQKIEVRDLSQAPWGGTGREDPRGPALLSLLFYGFVQILLCTTRVSALLLLWADSKSNALCAFPWW